MYLVFHVHVHIMPRRKGDFEQNDQIYNEVEFAHWLTVQIEKPERKKRTKEEMAKEAEFLSQFFPESNNHSFYPEENQE